MNAPSEAFPAASLAPYRAAGLPLVAMRWETASGQRREAPQCEACGMLVELVSEPVPSVPGAPVLLPPGIDLLELPGVMADTPERAWETLREALVQTTADIHRGTSEHRTLERLSRWARDGLVPLFGAAIPAATRREVTRFMPHDLLATPELDRTPHALLDRPFVRLETAEDLALDLPARSPTRRYLELVVRIARACAGEPWWRAAYRESRAALDALLPDWMLPRWPLFVPAEIAARWLAEAFGGHGVKPR